MGVKHTHYGEERCPTSHSIERENGGLRSEFVIQTFKADQGRVGVEIVCAEGEPARCHVASHCAFVPTCSC
eukprot:2854632-Amphidinium_carterae.2